MNEERAEDVGKNAHFFTVAFVIWIVSFFTLSCFKYDQKFPYNYILLLMHTFGTAHIITFIVCRPKDIVV